MRTLILNDVHLGVRRAAGTTPDSQAALRGMLQNAFQDMIMSHLGKDLIIAGDLFDGFEVDTGSVLECYMTLSKWLATRNNGRQLVLVAGNHDIGKRSDRYSSFAFLSSLLQHSYPDRVHVVDKSLFTFGCIHIIPHCMNQDLFNLELDKALGLPSGYLIIHANVDNGFAENSDHSLNVDNEQLTTLARRHVLLFAHEHQARDITRYKNPIRVLGNQWPSSIADCLAHGEAQKDGKKYALIINEDMSLENVETWKREGDLVQVPWDDLGVTEARFIRVIGSARADQAADVVSAIAKYRSKSDAFVISNAVRIEGISGMDDLAEVSFENVKAFDVLGALLEQLTTKEANVVRELLEPT